MKPVRPAVFSGSDLIRGGWEAGPGGTDLKRLIVSTGLTFPSVALGYSARTGAKAISAEISRLLAGLGLNVFLPKSPVPIMALSLELGRRSMPLGLYLDESVEGKWSLLPLALHGGPVDDENLPLENPAPLARNGVVGEIDLLGNYLCKVEGLLDPYAEAKVKLSSLDIPFPELERGIKEPKALGLIKARDPKGPRAIIDPSGQGLTIVNPDGTLMSTDSMVKTIGEYLTRARSASGAVVCPNGKRELGASWGEVTEINGDGLEMSHVAGFVNLLFGWWEGGIIAHQGHGPFGDALLTLGYLLEAWSWDR